MDLYRPIKRALISVSDKTGVVEFAKELAKRNVEILSTGGTAKLLEENGIVQNFTDSKINQSKTLNLYGLHRMYALEDSAWKIILKIEYRHFRYGG